MLRGRDARASASAALGMLVIGAAFAMIAGQCACGCKAAEAAEAAYASEHIRCVDAARTLEESRECRRQVRARWGVDGGER